ncbi:MAG: hypothetical protein AAFX44_10240 [Pseudomonadota bacterium]
MLGKYYKTATICVAAAVAAACGGGGGDDGGPAANQPPPPPPPSATQSGVFKDANVTGLSYVSGQQSGVTDGNGRYTCETGQSVTFTVGSVELGSTDCATLASPPALVASGELDDPAAVNMARFLLMLDGDEDPSNGITIGTDLQAMADSWQQIDFAAADFATEVAVQIADIASVEQRTAALPASADALAHVEETLSCAYSGAFVGQLAGSNTGAVAFAFAPRLFGFAEDEFSFQAFDANEEFVLATSGPYRVAALPSLDSSSFDQTVIVDAGFDTPDSLTGTWSFPPESRSGTLSATRLGADTGRYRVTGTFGGTDFAGVLVLDIAANGAITGEAFEVGEGTSFTIVGEFDGTNVGLEIDGGDETLTAIGFGTIDADGTPERIDGELSNGGTWRAAGCRLN